MSIKKTRFFEPHNHLLPYTKHQNSRKYLLLLVLLNKSILLFLLELHLAFRGSD